MNLWVLSDLHLTNLDAFGDKLRIPNAHICIAAGDVSDDLESSFKWMTRVLRPHMPVIYVLGNHDFFGRSLDTIFDEARELAARYEIILLENGVLPVRLGDQQVRIVGSTLWTDFDLHGRAKLAMEMLCESMPEYHHTSVDQTGRRMRPADAWRMHMVSFEFLMETLSTRFDGKTVVVTHHCPHPNSILEKFRGDSINPAFASDLSDLIYGCGPDLWIHGHTHASHDYMVGNTRILCNPRGNGGNRSFDWRKVVSV